MEVHAGHVADVDAQEGDLVLETGGGRGFEVVEIGRGEAGGIETVGEGIGVAERGAAAAGLGGFFGHG